jgi:hypothetical protein
MTAKRKPCAVEAAVLDRAARGHNGGPALDPLPVPKPKAQPFGLRAAWLRFAHEVELRRLAVLHVRIERKKATMDELVKERQRIMQRCIRRGRRIAGKDL